MNEPTSKGHPVGPEVDDSQNPTFAAPSEGGAQADAPPAGSDQPGQDPAGERAASGSGAQRGSRDMLLQLQAMIDSLATQAGPVMRDVAAKAAELAALAGEKAGPIAHRAAEATERVGVKVAERSKVMASELRRQQDQAGVAEGAESGAPAPTAEVTDATTPSQPVEPAATTEDLSGR